MGKPNPCQNACKGDVSIDQMSESPASRAFAAEVRGAVRALLPEGSMLRRDRGASLFVTDAPRREPGADWPERFAAAGFLCAIESGLAHLTPDGRWLAALSARYPEPPDHLCAMLRRFEGPPPDRDALALFAEALKLLDGAPWDPGFDRRLRQRAAVCLRTHRPGGGLYACALARHAALNVKCGM